VGDTVEGRQILFVLDSSVYPYVYAPAPGTVQYVPFSAGNLVHAGDVLAVVDSDKWLDLDVGNNTIALTYAVNDIAELKSRQANRSNAVKLPRTAKNDLFFGVPSEPNSLTRSPYGYTDCRLFEDGIELFGKGAKLKLIETNSKEHVVSFYGSIFDLFFELRNTKLRDLTELGDIMWDYSNIELTNDTAPLHYGYAFPLMEWYIEDNPAIFNNILEGGWIVKANRLYPVISYKKLCETMLAHFGYTLELPDKVLNDERYKRAAIPFSRMEISDEGKEDAMKGNATGSISESYGSSYDYYVNMNNKTYNFNNNPASGVTSPNFTNQLKIILLMN
jgi:hypothetical protein